MWTLRVAIGKSVRDTTGFPTKKAAYQASVVKFRELNPGTSKIRPISRIGHVFVVGTPPKK